MPMQPIQTLLPESGAGFVTGNRYTDEAGITAGVWDAVSQS